jgi:hypothetical protein
MMRCALGAALLLVAAGAPAQPPPADAGRAAELPALRLPAARELADALEIEAQAIRIYDEVWQPATEALLAANPDRRDEARRFAQAALAETAARYVPIVALALDNDAIDLLDPDSGRSAKALEERARLQAAGGNDPAFLELANRRMTEIARLARTPDGIAFKALQLQGHYLCDFWRSRRRLGAQDEARCNRLAASPILARLAKTPEGRRLVRVSNFANVHLVTMIQLAHDAGHSIGMLMPAEKVRAAGLNFPSGEMSDGSAER